MKKFLILIALFVTCIPISVSYAENPPECRIKAAYLYNFAKFIKWPEATYKTSKSPIVIGVLCNTGMSEELAPLSLRTIRNRPIEIKNVSSTEDAQGSQLLYIDTEDPEELKHILDEFSTTPTVTIGDARNFASSGGIIQFATVRERIRFIINHKIAKKNNIQIDSRLLSLAIDVLEEK